MSRLIVKNLPAYLTQERLRKHFESSDGPGGTLTDVKLMLKPDGTSRRFGFIGYKSPQDAERAKKKARWRAPAGGGAPGGPTTPGMMGPGMGPGGY